MSRKLLSRRDLGIGGALSVTRNGGWFGNRNLFLHETALGVWYRSFPSPTWPIGALLHSYCLPLTGSSGSWDPSEVTCPSIGSCLSLRLRDPAGLELAFQHFVSLTGHVLFLICLHATVCYSCPQLGLGGGQQLLKFSGGDRVL